MKHVSKRVLLWRDPEALLKQHRRQHRITWVHRHLWGVTLLAVVFFNTGLEVATDELSRAAIHHTIQAVAYVGHAAACTPLSVEVGNDGLLAQFP